MLRDHVVPGIEPRAPSMHSFQSLSHLPASQERRECLLNEFKEIVEKENEISPEEQNTKQEENQEVWKPPTLFVDFWSSGCCGTGSL